MNHWLISDTHFGHNNMVTKGHRPENFSDAILINLGVIGNKDILYHLGDFSFYRHALWHEHFMEKCEARKKILILGNHDTQTMSWYYDHGWDCVCSKLILEIFGKILVLTHEPLNPSDLDFYGDNVLNLHGHIHNTNHRNAELDLARQRAVIMEHEYMPLILRKFIGM